MRPLRLQRKGDDPLSAPPPASCHSDLLTLVPQPSSSPLPLQGKILVGTKDGEIIEVGEKNAASNLLLDSHARGGIWGLSTHPAKELCITASDDATIRLWDLSDKVSGLLEMFRVGARLILLHTAHLLSPCRNCSTRCVSATRRGV